MCIDSIPKSYYSKDINIPMKWNYGDIYRLLENGNMRYDYHILIREAWLKQEMTSEEEDRLIQFKMKLEAVIELNSDIRWLTNSKEEKTKREQMNNYNRSKLRIIEAMLN